MDDNFAFLLPVMMGTFSVVFLLLARMKLGLASAASWGVAFSSGAAAFSVALLPISADWQALIGDMLFFLSFYAYGDGLLIQFNRPRRRLLRLFGIALCLAVDAVVIFWMQSLDTELLLVDLALSFLLAIPVMSVALCPRNIVDRALVTVAALVVMDTFLRVILFTLVLHTSDAIDDFNASQYSFFMQISGGALGLFFALAALGSVLMELVTRYRDAAERDPLTGLFNRRGFEAQLERLYHGKLKSAVVLTLDIDHFKRINDTYGHATGDQVISGLARCLSSTLPQRMLSARFGGEEFIVFAPEESLESGKIFAQAVCDAFSNWDWRSLGITGKVTVSLGVASAIATDRTVHDTIARADQALYLAKTAGRNQVACDGRHPVLMARQSSVG